MNERSNQPISKQLLQLIQENDGYLSLVEIISTLGINTAQHRSECLESLRMLEQAGAIRSESLTNCGVRYWIVRPSDPPPAE
jgi:hypothetical protein